MPPTQPTDPARSWRGQDPLPPTLVALTGLTGAVDAICFLGLGQVFTANMTGNVVLLGFAVAGAEGLTVGGHLVSLGAFVGGALIGSRLLARMESLPRTHWLLTLSGVNGSLLLVAAALAIGISETSASLGERAPVIALAAVAMGIRNATVHELHVPDLPVSVITTTLTGLVTDSAAGGHKTVRPLRRAAAVAAMFVGAVGGAVLTLQASVAWALLAVAITGPVIAGAYWLHPYNRWSEKHP